MISWGYKHVQAERPQDAHIIVKNLTMAYGSFVIQQDLTFTVQRGDIFIIMGGSGCGKSTLLRHLIGLQPQHRGRCCTMGRVSGRSSRPSVHA